MGEMTVEGGRGVDTTIELERAAVEPKSVSTRDEENATALRLDLWVRDLDVVAALAALPEGRRRDDFTLGALKIGVLALGQAQGRIDADTIRNEGERLISALSAQLVGHQGQMSAQLAGTLKEYFDPASGRFNERVERLIREDGDLERVLRTTTNESVAALRGALEPYLGENSRLVALLTPGESNALVIGIRGAIDQLIGAQQSRLLTEFSLDNKAGALSRLVAEISTKNGNLGNELRGSIQDVVKEFSLDSDESALSRLVKRVEAAQRQISSEFTLDSDQSALSRMKRDLSAMIDQMRKDSAEFQQRVVAALESMKARKQESLASTAHGRDFEQAAFEFIQSACQQAGDIPERTGDRTGVIRNCKKGDFVITLGPDADAAGARIVCEAKEHASHDLATSLAELQDARSNREAAVGFFIHSARTAPAGLRSLARYGNDVVVVWDAENSASDVFLAAGLMLCKALALRKAALDDDLATDFADLDKAIREVERQAGYLGDIETSAQTVKGGAEKILKRVETMRSALQRQVDILDKQSQALRSLAGDDA